MLKGAVKRRRLFNNSSSIHCWSATSTCFSAFVFVIAFALCRLFFVASIANRPSQTFLFDQRLSAFISGKVFALGVAFWFGQLLIANC
jgi:hypothetical protein